MSADWRHWFKKKEHHGYDAHKTKLGKVWHFLAHDESMWSFIADAILVIVIGKFIILPLLSLALGTSFPMVAVVSSSMDHHGSFDSWWEQNKNWYAEQNITKEQFQSFPNTNGFSKGDVFIVHGTSFANLKIGDVVVYTIPGKADPIIHRIIRIENNTVQTKGDANQGQLSFELDVRPEQIKGKAVFRIPLIGWVKVGFVELMSAFKR